MVKLSVVTWIYPHVYIYFICSYRAIAYNIMDMALSMSLIYVLIERQSTLAATNGN